MPSFQFEAMDATGQEIRDVVDAGKSGRSPSDDSQDGYFVTKIAVKKSRKTGKQQQAAATKTRKKGIRLPSVA